MLIHLSWEEGYQHKQTVKNAPALASYGAITIKDAPAATTTTLPEQLRRSVTRDCGKVMSAHAVFKIETGVPVFFADPQSPWQGARTRTPMACCVSPSPKAVGTEGPSGACQHETSNVRLGGKGRRDVLGVGRIPRSAH